VRTLANKEDRKELGGFGKKLSVASGITAHSINEAFGNTHRFACSCFFVYGGGGIWILEQITELSQHCLFFDMSCFDEEGCVTMELFSKTWQQSARR